MSNAENVENDPSKQTQFDKKYMIIGGVVFLLIVILVIILVVVHSGCPGGNWSACMVRSFRSNIPSEWYNIKDEAINVELSPVLGAALKACAKCDPLPFYGKPDSPFIGDPIDPSGKISLEMLNAKQYEYFITQVEGYTGLDISYKDEFDSLGDFAYSNMCAEYWTFAMSELANVLFMVNLKDSSSWQSRLELIHKFVV